MLTGEHLHQLYYSQHEISNDGHDDIGSHEINLSAKVLLALGLLSRQLHAQHKDRQGGLCVYGHAAAAARAAFGAVNDLVGKGILISFLLVRLCMMHTAAPCLMQ